MNSKTARKLRQLSLSMVAAAQEQGKTIEREGHVINKQGTISNAKNTWKGAYKSLKRGLKAPSKGDAFSETLTSSAARVQAIKELELEQLISNNADKIGLDLKKYPDHGARNVSWHDSNNWLKLPWTRFSLPAPGTHVAQ